MIISLLVFPELFKDDFSVAWVILSQVTGSFIALWRDVQKRVIAYLKVIFRYLFHVTEETLGTRHPMRKKLNVENDFGDVVSHIVGQENPYISRTLNFATIFTKHGHWTPS
jgi:hypothetical protein